MIVTEMSPERGQRLLRALIKLEAEGRLSIAHGEIYHRSENMVMPGQGEQYKVSIRFNPTDGIKELADEVVAEGALERERDS